MIKELEGERRVGGCNSVGLELSSSGGYCVHARVILLVGPSALSCLQRPPTLPVSHNISISYQQWVWEKRGAH